MNMFLLQTLPLQEAAVHLRQPPSTMGSKGGGWGARGAGPDHPKAGRKPLKDLQGDGFAGVASRLQWNGCLFLFHVFQHLLHGKLIRTAQP